MNAKDVLIRYLQEQNSVLTDLEEELSWYTEYLYDLEKKASAVVENIGNIEQALREYDA